MKLKIPSSALVGAAMLAAVASAAASQAPSAYDQQAQQRGAEHYARLSPAEKAQVDALGREEQRVLSEIAADLQAQARENAALNLSELIRPEFRRADVDGALTKQRLAKAREALKRDIELRMHRYGEMTELIQASSLTPQLKSYYKANFDKYAENGMQNLQNVNRISGDTISALELVAEIMRRNNWQVQGRGIEFESPAAAREYSDAATKLNALIQESAAFNASLQKQRDTFPR